jgi:flagellar motility protein MotE (MotC chaperone)
MTSKTRLTHARGWLFGAAVALAGMPALAEAQGWGAELQGWNTQVKDVTANTQPPAPQRKGTKGTKAGGKAGTAHAARQPASIQPAKPEGQKAAVTEPAKAEPAAPPPPPSAAAAADSAPLQAAADHEEPQDTFSDIAPLQRRLGDDALTTQVVQSEPKEPSTEGAPAAGSPASRYCSNIADAAIDARIAWQRQNLAEAEKHLQDKTAELEAKTAEYQRWLARRDEFAEKAKKTVVDIYTKMKPDAAALQLAALDEETAAAVLIKLDPRTASAVMNEMDPAQAARLTSIISGSAKGPGPKRPQPPAGNRS